MRVVWAAAVIVSWVCVSGCLSRPSVVDAPSDAEDMGAVTEMDMEPGAPDQDMDATQGDMCDDSEPACELACGMVTLTDGCGMNYERDCGMDCMPVEGDPSWLIRMCDDRQCTMCDVDVDKACEEVGALIGPCGEREIDFPCMGEGGTRAVGCAEDPDGLCVDADDVCVQPAADRTTANTCEPISFQEGASDPASLGASVAMDMSSNWMAVGAPDLRDGAVFLYRYDPGAGRWAEESVEIIPSNLSENARFGATVELVGDVLVVGIPGQQLGGDARFGAIAVYDLPNTTAGDPMLRGDTLYLAGPMSQQADQRFGAALDLSEDGTTLVVGAPGSRRVFVYDISGDNVMPAGELWLPGVPSFGEAVATDGQTIVVGSPETNTVHTYFEDTSGMWVLLGPTTEVMVATGRFGAAVAMSGRRVFVGAPGGGGGAAAIDPQVFVYEQGTNTSLERVGDPLVAPIDAMSVDFGSALATDGRTLLVAGPGDELDGSVGLVYAYRLGELMSEPRVFSSGGRGHVGFGKGLAVSERWVGIGSPDERVGAAIVGRVSVREVALKRAE